MEGKLHNLADSFRRDRDEALRRKLTAQERLTLKQQEANAVAATVKSLQEKRNELLQQMKKGPEVEKLRNDVHHLTKEMQFQHAQLVNKQSKMQQLQDEEASDSRTHRNSIETSTQQVAAQREANEKHIQQFLSSTDVDESTAKLDTKKLLLEIENDRDGRLHEMWPRLVQGKIQFLSEKLEQKKQEYGTLKAIVKGYRSQLNLSIEDENESPVASSAEAFNTSKQPDKNEGSHRLN